MMTIEIHEHLNFTASLLLTFIFVTSSVIILFNYDFFYFSKIFS